MRADDIGVSPTNGRYTPFNPFWLPSAVLKNKYEKIFYFSKKSVDGLPI
jgi:hypothetical protein